MLCSACAGVDFRYSANLQNLCGDMHSGCVGFYFSLRFIEFDSGSIRLSHPSTWYSGVHIGVLLLLMPIYCVAKTAGLTRPVMVLYERCFCLRTDFAGPVNCEWDTLRFVVVLFCQHIQVYWQEFRRTLLSIIFVYDKSTFIKLDLIMVVQVEEIT